MRGAIASTKVVVSCMGQIAGRKGTASHVAHRPDFALGPRTHSLRQREKIQWRYGKESLLPCKQACRDAVLQVCKSVWRRVIRSSNSQGCAAQGSPSRKRICARSTRLFLSSCAPLVKLMRVSCRNQCRWPQASCRLRRSPSVLTRPGLCSCAVPRRA